MQRVEVPVLIVGAGPVGLTAAILLARQGIESLVVDRRPGPHRAPQAHVANPRTLEIFRSAGLDRETLRRLATPRDDGSHVSWVTTLAGPELGRDRPAILYWVVDPACAGVFVAHDIDRTWVFMHPHDPDTEPIETFTEEACAAIVRRAIGAAHVDLAVRDVSAWTMTAQVAARYRERRVFLVGDSAHRFPPAGGMGMNTGVQDVHNLAWKLRAVRDGWAHQALMGSYESE